MYISPSIAGISIVYVSTTGLSGFFSTIFSLSLFVSLTHTHTHSLSMSIYSHFVSSLFTSTYNCYKWIKPQVVIPFVWTTMTHTGYVHCFHGKNKNKVVSFFVSFSTVMVTESIWEEDECFVLFYSFILNALDF